jgi:DNA-binding LytR/AlgR family response regulator
MPGLTGIDLGGVLQTIRPAPALVFVSGVDHAMSAFEVDAKDYVSKPASTDRLEKAIRKVLLDRPYLTQMLGPSSTTSRISAQDSGFFPPITPQQAPNGMFQHHQQPVEKIAVELAGKTTLIPVREIAWVQSQGDYVRIHRVNGEEHLYRESLTQLAEMWEHQNFLRVHRQYLVQLDYVSSLHDNGGTCELELKKFNAHAAINIPVSRRHIKITKDRLYRNRGQ